ncbi:hypothetical protein ACFOEY_15790 [Paracandidimonas soli]
MPAVNGGNAVHGGHGLYPLRTACRPPDAGRFALQAAISGPWRRAMP